MDRKFLQKLCSLIRYDILASTTAAGSGHPTSSLSAVELLTTLFFSGFYHFDLNNPHSLGNDRFILSKGHASPLLYSLYHAAGAIDYDKLLTLRKFESSLGGHPNPAFPYVEVATGSLGQGLSNGIGMALGIRLRITNGELIIKREPKIFVLMGDSEMAEGQVWEAMEIASYYKLNNLVGIIDVNRLGQRGETEEGWDIYDYQKKAEAFGWETIVIDNGHNIDEIKKAYEFIEKARTTKDQKPIMIIARTVKGKGVSFLEDKENWHGKALDNKQLKTALKELGEIDHKIRGIIKKPQFKIYDIKAKKNVSGLDSVIEKLNLYNLSSIIYDLKSGYATREAYGDALVKLGRENPNLVVLDAEVANSTYENKFQKQFPSRFFEMFIAEENMMGVALGLSKIGFIPFVSTFAAFLTQTYDQVRMAQYSFADIKIVGSHAGVSIGQDGPSQMGLEDIAMFRSILNSVVFYPSDNVSTLKLTRVMSENKGIFYLRTTRAKTPILYDNHEEFKIGGLKIHQTKNLKSKNNTVIISAGITLHEAIKAQKHLARKGVRTTVVDLYSVKPLDKKTLLFLTKDAKSIVVVEDHYPYGGIGEAIASLGIKFRHLCVKKTPCSGSPEELLHFEEIDSAAIIKVVLSSLLP